MGGGRAGDGLRGLEGEAVRLELLASFLQFREKGFHINTQKFNNIFKNTSRVFQILDEEIGKKCLFFLKKKF